MINYKNILIFFDEYIAHYRELLSFENQKLSLLVDNDIKKLNDSLSKEQALVMKGNSLEAKRIKLMKDQGIENISFSEIIDNSPIEYKMKLTESFEALKKYVNETKRINDNAMMTVNNRLSDIDKRLSTKESSTYDEHGGKNLKTSFSSSLSRNI